MHDPAPHPLPRVAMLIAGDLYGGAERQLFTLCRAGRHRFEATVVPTLPGPVAGAARDAGIACEDLGAAPGLGAVVARLRAAVRAGRYDLIHCHGYRASVLAALALLGSRPLPVVRTVHGAPEARGLSKLAAYEALGRLADRWTGARLVYVSDELAARLGHADGSVVIRNGVEPPAPLGGRPVEFEPRKFHVVAVGRLEPVKALDTLIDAMAQPALRERACLHLVGDGPLRAALTERAAAAGLAAVVRFHGFRRDALNLIGHADCLALSSRHEGIPYVVLEALALGTPVVATRVGGIPEVIRDDVDGLLVAPGSPSALAGALARLGDEPGLRERLSHSGQARIAIAFSASGMAGHYADLYGDALARVKSPRR